MNSRPSLVLTVVLAALFLAAHGTAFGAAGQESDGFTGTWRLNPAKSSLPEPAPKSVVGHIASDLRTITLREEVVDAKGSVLTVTATAAFDGKDYPVTGSPSADSVSYVRVGPGIIKGTGKKDGKVVMRETVVLAQDGRSFTATYADPTGKIVGTAVFERQ